MLKSMTGYGAAKHSDGNITINVEVKTLNSKFLDLSARFPKSLSANELEIRNTVTDILQRGKVSLNIDIQHEGETQLKQKYNEVLFAKYYEELEKLADLVGVTSRQELFKMALSAPDVIINLNNDEEQDSDDWGTISQMLSKALLQCDEFRLKEGAVLTEKFKQYIASIAASLRAIESLDPQRVEKVRSRIKGNLKSFIEEEAFDKNRLEQEIIYYIEKFDITEEKVRLSNHLDHFLEVLSEDESLGKKLGFISQEIGREINTIGSKANDSAIQKHVVSMKEELEKIKEQLLNVL